MALVWETSDGDLLIFRVADDEEGSSSDAGSIDSAQESQAQGKIESESTAIESPIAAKESWISQGFDDARGGKVWRYETCDDVTVSAKYALDELNCLDGHLVNSGYLDYSNRSWGCVFAPDDLGNSSIVVTMIPSSLGEDIGSDNALNINVTMIECEKA